MRRYIVCQGTWVCYSLWCVVPRLSSSCSFPLSNSRLRLSPLSPSACSSVPEFLRVLNFSETTSLGVRLGPGLNLNTRLLLPPPSRLTTSEAERDDTETEESKLYNHMRVKHPTKDLGFVLTMVKHQILHNDALKHYNNGKQGGFCCFWVCCVSVNEL